MKNCDIDVFAGDDSQIVPVMSLGGKGVVSVYGNIDPKPVLSTYNYCLLNKYKEASFEYFKYHDKIKELFIETNPIPVKRILSEKGLINNSEAPAAPALCSFPAKVIML